MKYLFPLILTLTLSPAFASGHIELSQSISRAYQEMIDEQPAGNYLSHIVVTYSYVIATGLPAVSLPVTILPNQNVVAPSTMDDCLEDSSSLACVTSVEAYKWYQVNQVREGQFEIYIYLAGGIKKIVFPVAP